MMPLIMFLQAEAEGFGEFTLGFARVIKYLLGILAMISLVVTVIHVMQGDREAAKKMVRWTVTFVAGFILVEIISHL